jgi:hypothetical protein
MANTVQLLSSVASTDSGEYMVVLTTPTPMSAFTTFQLSTTTGVKYAFNVPVKTTVTANTYLFFTRMNQGNGASDNTTKIKLTDAVYLQYYLASDPLTPIYSNVVVSQLLTANAVTNLVCSTKQKSLTFTFTLDPTYASIASYNLNVSLINQQNVTTPLTNLKIKPLKKGSLTSLISAKLTPAQLTMLATGSYSVVVFPVILQTKPLYGPLVFTSTITPQATVNPYKGRVGLSILKL